MSLRAGEILLDRYEVLGLIGSGGYGVIYKARQITTGQLVAIKTLHESASDDPNAEAEIGRFLRETRVIAELSHPHIVQLFDSGVSDHHRFMVLEFVDGLELGKFIETHGPLSFPVAKRLFQQILDALSLAHQRGIIHRDLKPQNIMLTGPSTRPNVKVLDFGIAGIAAEHRDDDYLTLTQKGSIPGTPSYMAPEQIRLGQSTPASDIYALGLILLECLTGTRAVTGASVGDICVKQVTEPVRIPDEIAASPIGPIIAKACSKGAEQRYQSAEEMLLALDASELPAALTTGRVPLQRPLPPPPSKRSRTGLIIAFSLLIALFSVGIVFLLLSKSKPDAESPENALASPGEEPIPNASLDTTDANDEQPAPETNAPSTPQPASFAKAVALGVAGLVPRPVELRWAIDSSPSAKVTLGKEVLCPQTPCELRLPAAPEEPVTLSASGYQSQQLKLNARGGEQSLKLRKRNRDEKPEIEETGRIVEFD
ncbi:MAG: serine/threonine-protein kinase [Myxococcota bacterium]|jgi:serine/threonine protein kinase|nr:serine/threonine-protein kinase [Myxococcota bacterium]